MSIRSSITDMDRLTKGRNEDKKEIISRFLGISGSSRRFDGKKTD